jgi:quercetin dioxygenase-like cupin family protein
MTDASLPPTAQKRIAQQFDHTPFREADFHTRGPRTFLHYRDAGLSRATGGLMSATHIRATAAGSGTTGWHSHDLDFQLVYVLKGWVEFAVDGGEKIRLEEGGCGHIPGRMAHDEMAFSADYEVLEIKAPGDGFETYVGRDAAPPLPARPGYVSELAISHDGPDAFKSGDGPRAFLSYRDVGVTQATARRVNINIVKMTKAGEESTGWHYHTLSCQYIYILKGWTKVAVEGKGEFLLKAGDAMTIPHGCKHDVPGFSADFTVFELNIPGDYETIACDPPGRQAA